jgi:ketosteroid isomerase-like protein
MSPTRLSRLESAIRVVIAFNEAFNRHDVQAMMQLMSDDFIFESKEPAPDGALHSGKEAIGRYWRDLLRRSKNARIEIEEVFGLGTRCVMRWKYAWMDAAGKEEYVRGVDVFRVKGGLICELLSYAKV